MCFLTTSIILFTQNFKLASLICIFFILIVGAPIVWRSSEASFQKVLSICSLLTGVHMSFTIFADVISQWYMAQFKVPVTLNTPLSLTLVYLSAYVVKLVLVLLVRRFLKNNGGRPIVSHLFQTQGVSWVTLVSSMLMMVAMQIFNFYYYDIVFTNQAAFIILFGVYLLFGTIFGLSLAILSYIRLYQDKLKAAEVLLIQQQSYNRVLEDIQQDVRHFQHDYKNILSSFYLQLKEGRVEEAQALLEEKFLSFDQNVSYNIKQMSFLNNIKPMEIKSLLLTKMLQMEQQNIKFQVEVMDAISEFHIETEDLVRCLGILLDNAMEEESLTDEKTVHFVAYREESTVTIMIKNHLKEEKKIAEITQEGYSTKGENRGIGLSSYQKILNKYPNVFNKTVVSDNQFQQVIKMQTS